VIFLPMFLVTIRIMNTIEQNWQEFLRSVPSLNDFPPAQLRRMRMSFFAGAAKMLVTLRPVLDTRDESVRSYADQCHREFAELLRQGQ